MLKRKVAIVGMNVGMAKDWPCHFRKSVRQEDQWLGWRPQPCRAVRRIKIVRLGARLGPPEGNDKSPGIVTLALHQGRRHVDSTTGQRSTLGCYRLYVDSAHWKPNVVFGEGLRRCPGTRQVIQVGQLPVLLEPVVSGNPMEHGSHPQGKALYQPYSPQTDR